MRIRNVFKVQKKTFILTYCKHKRRVFHILCTIYNITSTMHTNYLHNSLFPAQIEILPTQLEKITSGASYLYIPKITLPGITPCYKDRTCTKPSKTPGYLNSNHLTKKQAHDHDNEENRARMEHKPLKKK